VRSRLTYAKKRALTGVDINPKNLGTVPEATHAASADTLPPPEAVHRIGSPGDIPFLNGTADLPPATASPLRRSTSRTMKATSTWKASSNEETASLDGISFRAVP
jgi:hypothetical protein